MISAMQRLGFTPSVTIEQRKLAVDLAEVVIKWELQRIKDQLVNYTRIHKHTLKG
jgi:transformation/transcription domain-associated protein